MLRVEGLSHAYESGNSAATILDGLSLELGQGQSVALLGRSGSGKSTLLNIISGLEPLQHGHVTLFGQSIEQLSDHRRTLLRRQRIGFIYQAFNLIPTLSIGDNISLPLALAGTGKQEQQARLRYMLDAVGLDKRMHDYPDTLSGGEQQRVAIARALVHQPALILADEPTGNLDALNGRHILELLQSLVAEHNSAMIVVTHSLEVARIAGTAMVMRDGRLHTLDNAQLDGSSAW